MYLNTFLTLAFLKLFSFITCHTPRQVCYGELGCFANTYPFYDPVLRPIDSVPDSSQEINTKYYLYSYLNQDIPQEIDPKREETIRYSTLTKKLKLKIIINGLADDLHQTNQWIHNLIKNLHKTQPLNIIVIDWTDLTYPQAVANSRVVGAQVAQLITELKRIVSTPLSSIEIIGLGVGAHIAGYAGQRLNGSVGRITGLSPAKLYFDGLPDEVKLDGSDAQVVHIINNIRPQKETPLEITNEQGHITPRLG